MLRVAVVLILVAVAIYLGVRAAERSMGITRQRKPKAPPARPVAPDDDVNFLRDLERKRLREQKDQAPDEDPPPTEPT